MWVVSDDTTRIQAAPASSGLQSKTGKFDVGETLQLQAESVESAEALHFDVTEAARPSKVARMSMSSHSSLFSTQILADCTVPLAKLLERNGGSAKKSARIVKKRGWFKCFRPETDEAVVDLFLTITITRSRKSISGARVQLPQDSLATSSKLGRRQVTNSNKTIFNVKYA